LHTHLPIDSPVPELIIRTSGSSQKPWSETEQLRQQLTSGRCYVLDRGFQDASLLNDIHRIDSSYVCRTRNNLKPQVLADLPLSPEAQAAGVLSDQRVKISTYDPHPSDHPVRLIVIRGQVHPKRPRPQAGDVMLVTNLMEEPPELIAPIYRYRWTIELFFRMLKQLLGCRHLLSHRGQGVDIQMYCAVIACLLIYLQTGKKPNKYMLFMAGMYLSGVASLDDLIAFVNRPDNTGVKQHAKAELWKTLGVH
jgi:Transposase DDE domain